MKSLDNPVGTKAHVFHLHLHFVQTQVLKSWQFYSSDKLNYYLNDNYIPKKTLIYLETFKV